MRNGSGTRISQARGLWFSLSLSLSHFLSPGKALHHEADPARIRQAWTSSLLLMVDMTLLGWSPSRASGRCCFLVRKIIRRIAQTGRGDQARN